MFGRKRKAKRYEDFLRQLAEKMFEQRDWLRNEVECDRVYQDEYWCARHAGEADAMDFVARGIEGFVLRDSGWNEFIWPMGSKGAGPESITAEMVANILARKEESAKLACITTTGRSSRSLLTAASK
jgi:hypothetical protein